MDLTQTASPLEIAWTFANGLGMFVAWTNLWEAFRDLQALRAEKRNGVLLVAAKGERFDQACILSILTFNTVMGFLAMFALPGKEPDGDPSLSSEYTPLLLILAAGVLIWLSISKRIRRKVIIDKLRKVPRPLDDDDDT